MHPLIRRASAIAAAALVAGALTTSPDAARAATAPDPRPASAAASWLSSHLTNGLLPAGAYGYNYGADIDAALSLAAIGGHSAQLSAILGGVAAHINDYISGDSFGDTGSTYSGAVAKAAVLAQVAGGDATAVGGVDLISRLEGQVQPSGRIADTSQYGDYANVLGQAFAARALAAAGAADASKATSFLLTQQCAAGWFRQGFDGDGSASAPTQNDNSCDDDSTSTPSVDATATAILELLPQKSDDAVASALSRAEAWLKSSQGADGAWVGQATGTKSANTTGLAAWALGALGDKADAAKGAAWVRSNQLANVGACAPFASGDVGALAASPAGVATARTKGVAGAIDQFEVATAQAAASLLWAPAASAPLRVTGPRGYVRAGSAQSVSITGEAPGVASCLKGQAFNAATSGRDTRSVRVSAGVASYALADADGRTARVTIAALGPKTLKIRGANVLHRGKKSPITVKGLASGEHVKVTLRGKKVASGTAKSSGIFKATVKLKGAKLKHLGKAKLKVTGQFADIRKGVKTVKVVR
jgi:hypothetical protein